MGAGRRRRRWPCVGPWSRRAPEATARRLPASDRLGGHHANHQASVPAAARPCLGPEGFPAATWSVRNPHQRIPPAARPALARVGPEGTAPQPRQVTHLYRHWRRRLGEIVPGFIGRRFAVAVGGNCDLGRGLRHGRESPPACPRGRPTANPQRIGPDRRNGTHGSKVVGGGQVPDEAEVRRLSSSRPCWAPSSARGGTRPAVMPRSPGGR